MAGNHTIWGRLARQELGGKDVVHLTIPSVDTASGAFCITMLGIVRFEPFGLGGLTPYSPHTAIRRPYMYGT